MGTGYWVLGTGRPGEEEGGGDNKLPGKGQADFIRLHEVHAEAASESERKA